MKKLHSALTGCATPPHARDESNAVSPRAPMSARVQDRALEDRILALDPERLSGDHVKTLAAGPAPRIILLHGGVFPVHLLMASFGTFLPGMGYPEAQIRDPGDG